jgi:hypothetical protein
MIEDPRYPALISAVRQAKSQKELSSALGAALEVFTAEAEIIGPTGCDFYGNMIGIAHFLADRDIRSIN